METEYDYPVSYTFRAYEAELNGEYLPPLASRFPENEMFDQTFFTGIRDATPESPRELSSKYPSKEYDKLAQMVYSLTHQVNKLTERINRTSKRSNQPKFKTYE